MGCEFCLEPPRRCPDGDVALTGAPDLGFGAERGKKKVILMFASDFNWGIHFLNISRVLTLTVFQVLFRDYTTPRLPLPPTSVGKSVNSCT